LRIRSYFLIFASDCAGTDVTFERGRRKQVKEIMEVGLVQCKHLSVDGSFVEANAAKASLGG
jgi:hypothetical protein